MKKTRLECTYEVRYENGASNILHAGLADSLEQAIGISADGILRCLPEGFDPENMVRPVIARKLGICALCGSDKNLRRVELRIGWGCLVCSSCTRAIMEPEKGDDNALWGVEKLT